jgi:spermidine/putrescine transport system permease protein
MKRINEIKQFILNELLVIGTLQAIAWQLFFFIVPIICMFALSLRVEEAPFSFSFTLEHYKQLIDISHFYIVFRSLIYAIITAFVCLILTYPCLYFITLQLYRFKQLFLFVLMMPFWTNILVLSYAWFFILDADGLINVFLKKMHLITTPIQFLYTPFAVILVMVYCYLPFMILPLFTVLSAFDRSLLEASADLGATKWQTFWRIIVPNTLPGIKTGLLLVFIPAFGEIVVPLLMGGDKYMVIGTLITHYIILEQNYAVGTAFTIFSIGVLFTVLLIGNYLVNALVNYMAGKRSA